MLYKYNFAFKPVGGLSVVIK